MQGTYTPLSPYVRALDATTFTLFVTQTTLAPFAALPAAVRRNARLEIQKILSGPSKPDNFPEDALLPVEKVQMHVPMPIGDYTDYCIA